MRQIRIGIIGLGGMAGSHIERLQKQDHVKIVAICDVDRNALVRRSEWLSIRPEKQYSEYEALIADPEVDAVLSILPNHLHFEIIHLCLRHRKPFMAEKPFTRTYQEAVTLKEIYSANPIPCMVGFSYRYVPSFRMAREWIQNGKIGRIRHVFIQYLHQGSIPMLEWPFTWRCMKSHSGTGALADLGSHMVDAARFLIAEVNEVYARMNTFVKERLNTQTGTMAPVDVDDITTFLAGLDGGIEAVFQTSRSAYGSKNQLEVSIYGDEGTLHMSCERPGELIWIHRDPQGNPHEPVYETIEVPQEFAVGQHEDFVLMLRGAERSGCPTFEDGFENQKVLEAIERSARTGQAVQIKSITI